MGHYLSRDHEPFRTTLDVLAELDELTVIVGAGSSIGAGLPGWRRLVEDLLARGLQISDESLSLEQARRQAEPLVTEYGPTAAAAMARVFFGEHRDDEIRRILYDSGDVYSSPSPIAYAVADLSALYAPDVYIATTNYDDLLERAIDDRVEGVTAVPRAGSNLREPVRPGELAVHHLHGYVPRVGAIQGPVILDERDYAISAGSAVDELARRLSSRHALFVGMSFTDSNVTTAGYRTVGQPQAGSSFALFVEESRDDASPALEHAVDVRLAEQGIRPIRLKSYAQTTQVLSELAVRKAFGDQYWDEASDLRYGRRLEKWRSAISLDLPRDGQHFYECQRQLSDALQELASDLEARFRPYLGDERFGLDLWARRPDDRDLGLLEHWATSTRVHRESWSLAPSQSIERGSTFLAVEALYFGAPLARDLGNVGSRWQYMWAVPVILTEVPWHQLPVGVITLGSTSTRQSSVLRRPHLKKDVAAALQSLADLGRQLMEPTPGSYER